MFDKKLDKKLEALEVGTARCESLNVDLVQQVKNLQERIKLLEKSSTVTKEDVNKAGAETEAEAEWLNAVASALQAAAAEGSAMAVVSARHAARAVDAVVDTAWDKYKKLRQEYENGN